MRKQFDLQYYLEHPDVKVVTRDGINVTIIDTEYQLEYKTCILAKVKVGDIQPYGDITAVKGGHVDKLIYYYTDGSFLQEGCGDSFSHFNLFLDLPDPKMRLVPLTYEDLLKRVRGGKTMWVKNSETCSYISYFDQCGNICFGDVSYSTEAMMKNAERFADDSPCWKEVEE